MRRPWSVLSSTLVGTPTGGRAPYHGQVSDPVSSRLLPAGLAPESTGGRRTMRDWVVDVVAFLLSLGWSVLMTWLWLSGHIPVGPVGAHPVVGQVALIADVGAGWLGALAIWLRRRWPVGLAVVLAVTGLFSMGSAVPASIALFTVAVHRHIQVALMVGVGYAASAIVYFAYRANPLAPDDPYLLSVGNAFVLAALVVGWGMFVRARRQLVLSLRDRVRRAEAEQQLRAEQARQLERQRIAREMHDVLAHRISLVSMHAGALEFRADGPAEAVAQSAAVIRENAHLALQELREVIGVLRTPGGDPHRPQPTLADLPELLEDSRRAGTRVRWHSELEDLAIVPATIGRTAYRIVQEALTNARKHAAGATVEVRVSGAAGAGLHVTVRNSRPVGRALGEAVPGTGTGLVGLAERASLVGGRLEYGHSPDGGFEVRAWLPWQV